MTFQSDLKKISITGPESSGKTTLALALANHFGFSYVAEYSREYLQFGGKIISSKDLVSIAKMQLEAERQALQSTEIIVCDTDILVLKIWNEEKFSPLHPALNALFKYHEYDYTLLCTPDLKWESDPLRENPADRDRLFELYKRDLLQKKIKFDIITGNGRSRFDKAKELINAYFQKH